MKKTTSPKLKMKSATVRVLVAGELDAINGGGPGSYGGCSDSCQTCYVSKCCNTRVLTCWE